MNLVDKKFDVKIFYCISRSIFYLQVKKIITGIYIYIASQYGSHKTIKKTSFFIKAKNTPSSLFIGLSQS